MISTDQPTIFDPAKITVAVSSREDGNTKPEWSSPDKVKEVIGVLAAQADVSLQNISVMTVAAHQDVWDEIIDVVNKEGVGLDNPAHRIPADALVTNVPGAGLLLSVADCNAVVVHDPVRNALALVHLGWQSTHANLATKVVQHLQQKYQSSASDLRVYFSPAIKVESYVFDRVSQEQDPTWQDFLKRTAKGVGIDLPGYNCQRLVEAGVLPEHIEVSPVDTATSDKYFSHYRSVRTGEPEGRFALLACLKG